MKVEYADQTATPPDAMKELSERTEISTPPFVNDRVKELPLGLDRM